MTYDAAYLFIPFLLLTCVLASVAIRSLWQFRYHKPFTPGLVLSVLTIGGSAVIGMAVTTSEPTLIVVLTVAVFCVSLGWLILVSD